MGKSNKSTSTSSVAYPQFVTDAQQNLVTQATNLATPIINGQQSSVAPWTPNQQIAVDRSVGLSQTAFDPSNDFADQLVSAGQQGYSPTTYGANSYDARGYSSTGYDPHSYGAASYTAATIRPNEIQALVNPFLETQGKQVLNDMRREKMATDAEIGARSASGVAFGGSGPALERAQLNRSYQENVGRTISDLQRSGYDSAAQLAAQNAQMEQQASADRVAAYNAAAQYNTDAVNRAREFEASAANNAGQYYADAVNAASQFGASANNDANATNMAAENAAKQYNLNRLLESLGMADSATSSAATRQSDALTQLLGAAGTEAAYQQSVLDQPRDALSWLSGFVPGITGTTTSTSKTPTNPLSTLVGLGALL